ncbi:pitrilysin family protein [Dactylosporangium sp. NPDC005555]|uniref:M16 family metallopeptidase n=1 Tax=Dactylosporangium sp. NPDC005555 TaxID=3154889 RepID=UPI0033A4031D
MTVPTDPTCAGVWEFPPVESVHLDNGVRVVTCQRDDQDVITIEWLIHAPLWSEPDPVRGVAGITLSAIFEGADERSALGFIEAIEGCGATVSTGVEHLGLRITVQVPGPYLAKVVRLVRGALAGPPFPPSTIDRLVRARLDAALRERTSPERRMSTALHTALFGPGHRLSQPAHGEPDTVRAIDRAAVAAFHAERFRPGSTTVVLVGDLRAHDAVRIVRRACGDWDGPGPAGVPELPGSVADGPGVVLIDRPGAVQSRLVLGRAAPGRSHPGWDPLLIGNRCLGGSTSSRLNRVLRQSSGATYGFVSTLLPLPGRSIAVARGAVAAEATGPSIRAVLDVLHQVRRDGFTDEEHRLAVAQVVTAAPLRYQTSTAVADEISRLLLDGTTLDRLPGSFAQAAGVTAPEAAEAVAAAFAPERLFIVAAGDRAVLQDQFGGLGPTTVLDLRH